MPAANELVNYAAAQSEISSGNWLSSGRGWGLLLVNERVLTWQQFKAGIINKVTDGGQSDPYSNDACLNYSQLNAQKARPPAGAPFSALVSVIDQTCDSGCTVANWGETSLTWSNADGYSSIEIWRDINGGGWVLMDTVPTGSTSYSDFLSSGDVGDQYTYRLRHLNDGIYSNFSNEPTVTIPHPCNC